MQIDIDPSEEALLHALVQKGRFPSLEAAVAETFHHGLTAIAMEPDNKVDEDWLAYANESIQAGLADAAAGRTISSEQFLAELNARHSKHA